MKNYYVRSQLILLAILFSIIGKGWAQCSISNPNGSFDVANCDGAYGWAFDQADLSKTVTVDIYVDGTKVSSIQANGDRQDLVTAFGNSAARYHGFSYSFPSNASWRNGQSHSITARICGTNSDLGGSPRAVSGCTGGTTTNPPGNCAYTEGQYLFTFNNAEAMYAHYYNSILYAAYQDGSNFRPQHWLTAAGYDPSKASCFAEDDPHTTTTTNPPTGGGNGNGLAGTYFNNTSLSGTPILSRTETTINFTWDGGGSSPFPGVPASNMSARWEGQVEAPVTGTYTFSTNNDDATNLWVNGQQLISDWPGGHAPTLLSGTINLQAGQKYSIKLEFNQGGGGAQAQLLWSYPGQGQQVIPQSRLYSTGTTTNPPGNCAYTEGQYLFTFNAEAMYAHYYNSILYAAYQDGSNFRPQHWLTAAGYDPSKASCFAEDDPHTTTTTNPPTGGGNGNGLAGTYFNNTSLSGTPILSRTETTINFTWDGGGSSPFPGVPASNMSARWEGQVEAPVTGTYTFSTNNDDATNLWVNGQQLISDWPGGHAPTLLSGTINLQAGQKYSIKLEFNQGGGGAQAQLLWSYPGQGQQIIPQARLYSSEVPNGGRLSAGGVGRILYPGDPNLNSSWDWTTPTYNLWYNTGTILPQSPSNPFLFNSSGRLYQDMYSTDGWMLVARDFGTANAAIRLPFYILYNKFRGILRTVIYYPDDQPAVTNHVVSLKFADNIPNHPALFSFAEKTADNSYLNQYDSNPIQKVTSEASPGSFIISDFNVVGYDPNLFDSNIHTYDDLGFSISVYHADVTDANLYSQLTLQGTVQPQSLGDFSDQLGTVSGFFAKSFDDLKKILQKPTPSTVFELINSGNEALNGLFGGGGGYNVTLKGNISTQGTLSTLRFGGTIDLYVKQKTSNLTPNYNPLNSIQYGLLNLNQLSIVVHKNSVSNNGCSNLSGQYVPCPQYGANGIDITPVLNSATGLRYQGASASYFNDQGFQLKSTSDPSGSGCLNISNPSSIPFKCIRYYKTRSGVQSKDWNEGNTDDVFSTIGISFTFFHPGYGFPNAQPNDPNPVVIYKEFKIGRSFVDGGRIGAEENNIASNPFPNPFTNEVSIPLHLKYINEGYQVQILSLEGKEIWSTQNIAIASDTTVLWDGKSSSGLRLPTGMYICNVSQKGVVIKTYKIILQQ